jgi:HlyD family secretion protein
VRLNATVTQNVITYPVIVEVPNPDLKLRPSMTANVVIRVATVRDVLRVPNSALRFRPATPEGQPAGGKTAAGTAAAGTAAGDKSASQASSETTGGQPAGQRRSGGQGGPASGGDGQHSGQGRGGRRQQGQTVYVLNPEDNNDKTPAMRPVQIRTGITDGHYTQVLAVISGTLSPGDPVITGLATVKVEAPAGANNRPPGGGQRGLGRF